MRWDPVHNPLPGCGLLLKKSQSRESETGFKDCILALQLTFYVTMGIFTKGLIFRGADI